MENTLCKYRDMFGKPREGVHSIRIFDVAVIDVIITIAVGYCIAKYFSYKNSMTIIIILFMIGTLLHILFCVDTKFVMVIRDFTKYVWNPSCMS